MISPRDKKLQDLGYPLDRIAGAAALYEPLVIDGTTVYAAGAIPIDGDKLVYQGKVPSIISVEQAQKAAALCAANILRQVIARLGSLDRVERILRVGGYVNADPDFTEPHLVINGASQLLIDVLGDAGRHARTAMGAILPCAAAVEIDMTLKIK
jgi:enamine deaminase RidA (YjgF/YER057c/UK114 family)